mgnify:CR=1 FL=1
MKKKKAFESRDYKARELSTRVTRGSARLQSPGLRLRLATSALIRRWAQRKLSNGQIINGQILNSKTVNYQTNKPERDGLFCERLFGPIQDFVCGCGRLPYRGEKFCANCEVEYTSKRVRRYRLGYIQLVTAVAHVWFFKGRPRFFSLFLNLSAKKVERLLYCTENISRTLFSKELQNLKRHLGLPKPWKLQRKPFYFFKIDRKKWRFWGFQKSFNEMESFVFLRKVQKHTRRVTRGSRVGDRLASKAAHAPRVQPPIFLYRFEKKSIWHQGGLRDSALYFGLSILSKMLSWRVSTDGFHFFYFLIHPPQTGDLLNKFYPGPPGIVNFWGLKSRLFCFTGIQIMRTWMSQLTQFQCHDGRLLEIQIRMDLLQLEKSVPLSENEHVQKVRLFRRFKYLRTFRHKKMNPASMVLSALPVLPPDLRPIIQLDDHMAVSDLNKLYQKVLFRNRRMARLTLSQNMDCFNSQALQYAQRLLQESVDTLIENDKIQGSPSGEGLQALKSLSDLFKGKKGRFRQNLLGKRVDYSGRSVIVVGPFLQIHECGLPQEIAYELFQPFLIRTLMFQKKAQTILGAKKLFQKARGSTRGGAACDPGSLILDLLKKIVQSHPILLNRAPSLHRFSIQAFQPRLIEGQAILLHPLVCSAFNADFDGDQMGVHLPLCFEARAEAWKITWSQNHLFSIATGRPICPPSQDIILGSTFLTTRNFQKFGYYFLRTYLFQKLKVQNLIYSIQFEKPRFLSSFHYWKEGPLWCIYNPWKIGFETENKKQRLVEIRLDLQGRIQKFRSQIYQQYHPSGAEILRKFRTTWSRLKFHQYF